MKSLKKFLRATFLVLVACYPQATVSVKNDCNTAWYKVSKLEGPGNYKVVDRRLLPGNRVKVELTGTSGTNNLFVIMVDGYRLDDNTPLGSATYSLGVDASSGGPTAADNNYSLNITQVYPGGCPAH